MKRWIGLLLVLTLLISGCNKDADKNTDSSTTSGTEQISLPDTIPSQETLPPNPPEGIQITEVMADNKYLAMGHDADWVELYNSKDSDVLLDGFYLTDDPAKPTRFSLEGMSIPSEDYLVVTLGEDAPFNLSADGESVYLFYNSKEYDHVTFGATENGESFSREGTNEYVTPGHGNTEEGQLASLNERVLPQLIINEVISSNSNYPAKDGKCYDLVEVRNISKDSITLSGYTLSDKRSEPTRYKFPNVTLQPGEYYVIYCSKNPSLGENHAPFKISADGETIYLSKDGVFTDALSIPGDLGKNESYGRDRKIPSYFPTPTPGKENCQGLPTGIDAPTADHPSGLYPDSISVTLTGEGTIYYTTDGSRPTTNSKIYSAPLVINGVTTIRTFCIGNGRTSAPTAYTYAVGASHDLPVVCVSIPQSSLTGATGVLNHIEENYEHEAMLTLIEGGEEKFSVPFGFRLHGNDSRKMPKQNFQLRFRSEYGASKLKYPLFEDRDINEYNSLLLKGGSEDWNQSMLRDELCTELANGTTNLYTQAIKPVVLYLGGQYWGIYYLRERVSDDYIASHLGVSKETADLLYSTAGYPQKGSDKDFKALKSYVQSHDMSKQEHYEYLAARIDVLSLADWYICRSFVGDMDLANIRRFRSTEADGKWHWVYFDLDWALYSPNAPSLTKLLKNRNGEPVLIKALLKSPQGRDLFLRRCSELYQTVFSEAHVQEVLNNLIAQIQSEIPRDRARWNCSEAGWNKAIQKVKDYFAGGKRVEIMKADIKKYFNMSDNEMQKYFG